MGLVLVNFGGGIYSGTTVGSPGAQMDEWSCSLAYINTPALPLTQARADFCASRARAWIAAATSYISNTVALEYVKVNEFNVAAPYHQITDPTMLGTPLGPVRGAATGVVHPTTTSYKVSLDDGTRNRRAKGGFYAPRTCVGVQNDGRIGGGDIGVMLIEAKTFVKGIATDTGWTLGVWSRRGGSVTAVSRIRIGDVPDNVSRRKDDLHEAYQVAAIP